MIYGPASPQHIFQRKHLLVAVRPLQVGLRLVQLLLDGVQVPSGVGELLFRQLQVFLVLLGVRLAHHLEPVHLLLQSLKSNLSVHFCTF